MTSLSLVTIAFTQAYMMPDVDEMRKASELAAKVKSGDADQILEKK